MVLFAISHGLPISSLLYLNMKASSNVEKLTNHINEKHATLNDVFRTDFYGLNLDTSRYFILGR